MLKYKQITRQKLTVIYSIHQLLHWAITGLIIPVIILLFQARKINLAQIGIVMAIWAASTAIFEIPSGAIADKIGRKVIYLGSLLLGCLAVIIFMTGTHIVFIISGVVFLGLSRAAFSGSLDAWFYDEFQNCTGELTFHKATAFNTFFLSIGLALGSFLGGLIPDVFKDHSLVSRLQSVYDLNLIAYIGLSIVLFIYTFIFINETQEEAAVLNAAGDSQGFLKTSIKALAICFSHETLKIISVTTIFFGMIMSSVEIFWQPKLKMLTTEAGIDIWYFGLLSALYFLVSAVSSLLSIPLLKLFNNSYKMLLYTSRTISGIVLILLAQSFGVLDFSIYYLVFFLFFSMGESSLSVIININTRKEYRASILSVYSLLLTGGSVFSSICFGFIAENFGINVVWIISSIVLLVSSLYFLFMKKQQTAKAQCSPLDFAEECGPISGR